jgi:DNA-binding NarL/FixJ family response regulator
MKPVSVLIADDHPLFRRGLQAAIELSAHYRVVAEAGDGESAIRQLETHRPAAAFVDLAMPVKDGLEVLAWAAKARAATRIVIMTLYKERAFVDRAAALGAAGYLVKDDSADEIVRCLDLVLEGEFYLSSSVGAPNPAPPSAGAAPAVRAALERLTAAQRTVLCHVADYRSSKEIARLLDISPKTVENHRANIAAALDLHGPNALLRFAVAHRDLLQGGG